MDNPTHNILLIGAGQLGSRHLQGLTLIDIPVSIQVVDPNEASLQTARERFSEMPANPRIIGVNFTTSLDESTGPIDLAIIATSSDIRAHVLTDLLNRRNVRYVILEKFLFQMESEYHAIASLLQQKNVSAFVNCPRRCYPFYEKLLGSYSHNGPVTFKVTGSNWGLACNSIHFLDLFAGLTGNSSLWIDGSSLDETIIASKRSGYVEFTGTIQGKNSRGDKFEISCSRDSDQPLTVSVITPGQSIEVMESAGKAVIWEGTDRNKREEVYSAPFQSQLTGAIAGELLVRGTCRLTTYQESMALHIPLLQTFLLHLNRADGTQHTRCPIT